MEDLSPSSHNVDVPHVSRTDYTLLDIGDDGFVSRLIVAAHGDGSRKGMTHVCASLARFSAVAPILQRLHSDSQSTQRLCICSLSSCRCPPPKPVLAPWTTSSVD